MGGSTIFADITDTEFLAGIDRGTELFGKRDALYVDLEIEQAVSPSGIHTRYTVSKVHKHERLPPAIQPDLPLPDDEPEA